MARDKAVENARLLMLDLNKMGITAFQDQGGTGMKASHLPRRGKFDVVRTLDIGLPRCCAGHPIPPQPLNVAGPARAWQAQA